MTLSPVVNVLCRKVTFKTSFLLILCECRAADGSNRIFVELLSTTFDERSLLTLC